jgi:hypothetical protein
MPVVTDEAQQLRVVATALLERFGDQVPEQRINAEVQAAADELYAAAKVRAFVPVLVQRRVSGRLRTVALPPES